jgi:hypothetical protein
MRKTELWVAIAGIVSSVCAAILGAGIVPEGSLIAVVVGCVVTACTYITGRSWVKGREASALYTADSGTSYSLRTSPPPLPTTNRS